MRKYIYAAAASALTYGGALIAHAQNLNDYPNLSTTRTLTFANVFTGAIYDQVQGVIPFLVQIGVLLIVIAVVFGIPYLIWKGVTRFTGGHGR